MRTKSKKPGKQRYYAYNISKNEAHKVVSAPLSKKLREAKGFRSLPVRVGDTVKIVRGDHKGTSGKVSRTDPRKQRIYIDGLVNRKTDATEIPVPIHPSNVIIEKYVERDRRRMLLINRRILDEEKKIDIEARMAEIEAEEEDLIEFDEDEDLDDLELFDDEFDDEEFDDDEDDFEIVDEDDLDEEFDEPTDEASQEGEEEEDDD